MTPPEGRGSGEGACKAWCGTTGDDLPTTESNVWIYNKRVYDVNYRYCTESCRDIRQPRNPQPATETPPACRNCEAGFPKENGMHYGTQRLGMIPNTPCAAEPPREPSQGGEGPRAGMDEDDAMGRLRDMAERWRDTKEWHDPPFYDGTIKVDTGDLHAASIILDAHDRLRTEVWRLTRERDEAQALADTRDRLALDFCAERDTERATVERLTRALERIARDRCRGREPECKDAGFGDEENSKLWCGPCRARTALHPTTPGPTRESE